MSQETVKIKCKACEGDGESRDSHFAGEKCEVCKGSGLVPFDTFSMSQETTEQKLKALLDDPRTGLKDSSDSNKTRYAILALIDEGVQAHTDRVVEAMERRKETGIACRDRELECDNFNDGIDTSIQIVKGTL